MSPELRAAVSEQSAYLCSYCKKSEKIVGTTFTVDHIRPESLGGLTVLENLCLACWDCNLSKGNRLTAIDPATKEKVRLFHPTQQQWYDHFEWQENGLFIGGITPTGRATVAALNLNRTPLISSRKLWIGAGWHPPKD